MPLNLGTDMLLNLGVIVFVIRFVRGVSRTLQVKSSNAGVDVVVLCGCEDKCCSIYAFNVLISLDIIFCIMTSTFIVLGGTGPSGADGNLGIDRRVKVVFLLGSSPHTGCVCFCHSTVTRVFPGVGRGCIRATGLFAVVRIPWG